MSKEKTLYCDDCLYGERQKRYGGRDYDKRFPYYVLICLKKQFPDDLALSNIACNKYISNRPMAVMEK